MRTFSDARVAASCDPNRAAQRESPSFSVVPSSTQVPPGCYSVAFWRPARGLVDPDRGARPAWRAAGPPRQAVPPVDYRWPVVTRIAGLLLAAGDGTRLGQPKATVELGGMTLAERGAGLLKDGGA